MQVPDFPDPVRLTHAAGKDVVLVKCFDRAKSGDGWTRKAMVSALILFAWTARIQHPGWQHRRPRPKPFGLLGRRAVDADTCVQRLPTIPFR